MQYFNYIIIVLGFLSGIILFSNIKKLRTKKIKPGFLFGVSVIIPARNEEHNLSNLFLDLKEQSLLPYEVICVDDDSTDGTADIIDSFGVRRITVSKLPAGWRGKTWACQQGAEAAHGELLLFLDADVRLSSTAIESLAVQFEQCQSPISVQPRHAVKKFYEYFSMFFNFVQIAATGLGLPGKRGADGMFGPVFMVSKELFFEHGGYSAVRSNVVEDFALGRYYTNKGIRLCLATGEDIVTFRMYPQGLGSLIEGWTKNFSKGAISTKWWLFLITIIWIIYLTALPIEIAEAASGGQYIGLIVLTCIYVASCLFLALFGKAIASYRVSSYFIYPVFLLGFHIIFIYSVIATFILKSATWKGRRL